jgi:hypothetical protein
MKESHSWILTLVVIFIIISLAFNATTVPAQFNNWVKNMSFGF